jgi:CRISPR-associated protein Csd2
MFEGDVPETVDVVRQDDVALRPGENGDPETDVRRYIDPEVLDLYDVYSYAHAAAILKNSFPLELQELEHALLDFRVSVREIQMPGGNESEIPKKLAPLLRHKEWVEAHIQGDLHVRLKTFTETVDAKGKVKKRALPDAETKTIVGYVDGHKIDYVKGRVAFDLEWNSKDQTFDRDLFAFRTFHECGVISVGVLVTRSVSLNPILKLLPKLKKDGSIALTSRGTESKCFAKMGASTTWVGKLLYRLNAGRHGNCPVLVLGITPKLISDWGTHERNPSRGR